MSNQYLGEICMFGGTYAPAGFAFCNGQTIPISQNEALFSLIGTVYGGNGVSTFLLPNLQSCVPIHVGQGPGLSSYTLGQTAGTPQVTLTTATMPAHNHALNATKANATASSISSSVLAGQPTAGNPPEFYANPIQGQPPPTTHSFANGVVSTSSPGNLPHQNLMPALCITFIIALRGIFPSRN